MIRLVLQRLLLGLLTLVFVSGIVFVAVEALPGDACTAYLGRMAKGTRLENCRRDFGIERPALTRYAEWTMGPETAARAVEDIDAAAVGADPERT